MYHLRKAKSKVKETTVNETPDIESPVTNLMSIIDVNIAYLRGTPVATALNLFNADEPVSAPVPSPVAPTPAPTLSDTPVLESIDNFLDAYKPTVPGDNIALALKRFMGHDFNHFSQHYESMVAEMKKNPAHACIWAAGYFSTRDLFNTWSHEQIIQSNFFKQYNQVFGKYCDLSKAASQQQWTMSNEARIEITKLLVMDKNFAPAILSLADNASVQDFMNICQAHHQTAYADTLGGVGKKQKLTQ